MVNEKGSTELKEAIDQLRKMSAQLNEVTDTATATVQRVEKFLNEECSIGMWGMVERKSEAGSPETVALRYDRVDSQFRILAQIKRNNEPDAFKPWANCNRETKLKSFPMLPTLLKTIAQEGLALCKHIQETNKIVKELTEAIDKK